MEHSLKEFASVNARLKSPESARIMLAPNSVRVQAASLPWQNLKR